MLPLNWNVPERGEAGNPRGTGVSTVVQSNLAAGKHTHERFGLLALSSDRRTHQEDWGKEVEALYILRANNPNETSCPIKSFSRELICVSSSI